MRICYLTVSKDFLEGFILSQSWPLVLKDLDTWWGIVDGEESGE